ncbi:hypothetical protein [Flagellimonas nanhaiensis]|uniref:Uncharacterized protein n=1 Tax=Flagellimonas nanhaiensis TaxID=2292706 RepID=A0A371JNM2_9FLAO|nr:hypothetical protein [Allomuricauda nanhaiensis]RDY58822.1 hypothetical protein DX873_14240 [Allomuricauda nanhaiensis]
MKNVFIILSFAVFMLSFSNDEIQLKWNFENKKAIIYDYSQKIVSSNPFFNDKKEHTLIHGKLKIKIKSDGLADVIFMSMKSYSLSVDEKGDEVKKDSMEMPNTVLFQDMNIFGQIDNTSNAMLAKTLFPIPLEKISTGQFSNIKMNFPFNYFGNNLNVKGFNQIKIAEMKGEEFHLESLIDVSELNFPEEIEQDKDLFCFLKGKSNHIFNSKQNLFTSGNLNIEMQYGTKEMDSISSITKAKKIMGMNTNIQFELIDIIK